MSNFEEKFGLKKSYAITLLIVLVLNVLWFISNLAFFSADAALRICIPFVMFLVTVFYVLYDYKKPHGNTIRHLLLVYSIYTAAMLILSYTRMSISLMAANLVIVITSSYMAGRLNKFNQNIVLSIVILLMNIYICYPFFIEAIENGSLTFISFFRYLGPVSNWLAIAGAYIARYQLHKEAGLED